MLYLLLCMAETTQRYLLFIIGIPIIQNNNQHLCIFYVRNIILNIWAYFSVSIRWNKLNNY